MQRRSAQFSPRLGLVDDPLWYMDAVIYELRVRSYCDSNADGVGDLPGLTAKLPYLEDLGVTAVWLLPFYPSPQRDDGYDISDYTDVHPEVGTLDDFRIFLSEAHRRGIRVITELVLNHTSDQHPWFQRARRAPPGSSEREFYVWSDTTDRFTEARIIFKDFEASNWAWDPVAKAYFWHRFYSHQPDLNFDNPDVQKAMLDVVDFWFGLGVDGLRLDAVPYLFEREGTNCENLPETHAFLRKLRRHVDAHFSNRMLLAEANQWPEDAAAYFGDGDECHMNYHFPIMPRLFMSISKEDRLPLVDILAQTPETHPSTQWALFLRNHDELTLEMVTDEERDYMYRAYAADPRARINLGIRRRLAPLAGNNRRNIELMNGLLFSLPGTPVLYYGDEIGMGDNVYLGDRDGVRTPMQWSADRNAGFSRANPQKLILPVIIDPEYHFESINVEAQQNNPNSLLWWTKRLIAMRGRFQAFGRGTFEFLSPDNPRVFAFLRRHEQELVLVVANLSRYPQYVELDLSRLKGLVPVELWGGTPFPPIGDLPYLLTLGPHAFYWFSVEAPLRAFEEAREASYSPPVLDIRDGLREPWGAETLPLLERVLPGFLEGRRWFGHQDRDLIGTKVLEVLPLREGESSLRLLLVRAEFAEGDTEDYALFVAVATGAVATDVRRHASHAVIAHLQHEAEGEAGGVLFEALSDTRRASALLAGIREGMRVVARDGVLVGAPTVMLPPLAPDAAELEPRLLRQEHRRACVVYDETYLLKVFHQMGEGTSPELEIGRALAGNPTAPYTPIAGAVEFLPRGGEPITLATLQVFVPGSINAAVHVREELGRSFERALTLGGEVSVPQQMRGNLVELAAQLPPEPLWDVAGTWLESARLLGARIGDLHRALAAVDQPAFVPEGYGSLYQRSLYQADRNLAGKVLRLLRSRLPNLPDEAVAGAKLLLSREQAIYRRFEPLRDIRMGGERMRIHGDLRLDAMLYTGRDFLVVDFEGDPNKPLAERRRKRSPLRDVASIVRSIEDSAYAALHDHSTVRAEDLKRLEPWTRLWIVWTWATVVRGYLDATRGASFLPRERGQTAMLLDAFVFEKALDALGVRLESGPFLVDRILRALNGMLEESL